MVQEKLGVLRYNTRGAIHQLFALVVILLTLGSCFSAAAAVSGGIIRPLDHDHEGREEPCALPIDDARDHTPSPCRTPPKSSRNRVVAGQEDSYWVQRRAQDYESSIDVEVVDASLRHGRQTVGEDAGAAVGARQGRREKDDEEEHLTTVGVAITSSYGRTEGAKSRRLKSDEECTKLIRGLKFGECRGSQAGGAGGAAPYRVLRAAVPVTTYNDTEALVLLGWKAGFIEGRKHVFAKWNLKKEPNVCLWRGVECGNATQQQHVVSINLAGYKLSGSITSGLSALPFLTTLDLSYNRLVGGIPWDLADISTLQTLNLSFNRLNGTIPSFGVNSLSLQSLNLMRNKLSGGVPTSLGQCQQLTDLNLAHNSLQGDIPAELGTLSNLQSLFLYQNKLGGVLPESLGSCGGLVNMSLAWNQLNGGIPDTYSKLEALQGLYLYGNNLTGLLPDWLSGLSNVSYLHLYMNGFEGPIPPMLGNSKQLRSLDLSNNRLQDSIPTTLLESSSLVEIDLSVNRLSGTIPVFDPAGSHLTEEITPSISTLSSLQSLNVSHNALTGTIPDLGGLSNLVQLDLSANNLSGEIPLSLSSMPNLVLLNVSDNILDGPVPQEGVFKNFSASSFIGNPGLCGPILQVICDDGKPSWRGLSAGTWIGIAFGVVGVLVAFLIIMVGFVRWRITVAPETHQKRGSIIARSELFYPQLTFTAQDLKLATENFSNVNVLGVGSLSSVYRGVLPELVLVAVKKLKMVNGMDIPPGFITELNELGRLRNRHLVAILGYCFDAEMSALVVQFMSNGSLEDHLHRGPTCKLEWSTRAKIAIGVAKALNYLHHDCGTTIVHCDLKPSNVLLDADFDAHLEDFGLSRLIFAHKMMDMTNSSVGSSMGYFPPEYGYSPTVSPKGDVYSFGILLLELLTGKKPTIGMFRGDMSLTAWCQASFPNKTLDVLDPTLTGSKETNHKQVNLFMKVALMCAKDAPEDRPTMKTVLDMLR